MSFVTIWGEPGCRVEEIARLAAQRLGFELVTEGKLRRLITDEFGSEGAVPDKAYGPAVISILARLCAQSPLVLCAPGAEVLCKDFPSVLRCHVVAGEGRRIGMLMLEHRLERPAAKRLLQQLERQERDLRKARMGKATVKMSQFDLIFNTEQFDSDVLAAIVEQSASAKGLQNEPRLSAAAEAQIQFQTRLQLAKFGIHPASRVSLKRTPFVNASEEIFANLLDFYRIAWEYEPRTFTIQKDKDGRVTEAFTPDFYLPEFDLYLELTTMKQSLVTKKNRKVKMLREMYPEINIQVFYQKDIRNLIFKYGLAERATPV